MKQTSAYSKLLTPIEFRTPRVVRVLGAIALACSLISLALLSRHALSGATVNWSSWALNVIGIVNSAVLVSRTLHRRPWIMLTVGVATTAVAVAVIAGQANGQ